MQLRTGRQPPSRRKPAADKPGEAGPRAQRTAAQPPRTAEAAAAAAAPRAAA